MPLEMCAPYLHSSNFRHKRVWKAMSFLTIKYAVRQGNVNITCEPVNVCPMSFFHVYSFSPPTFSQFYSLWNLREQISLAFHSLVFVPRTGLELLNAGIGQLANWRTHAKKKAIERLVLLKDSWKLDYKETPGTRCFKPIYSCQQ